MQQRTPLAELSVEPAALGGELGGRLLGGRQRGLQRAVFGHHPAVVQFDGLHQAGVAAGEVLHVVELGQQVVEGAGLEDGVQHAGVAAFVGEHEVIGELLLRDAQLVLVEAQRDAVGLGLPLQRLQVHGGGGVGAHRLVETAVERGDLRRRPRALAPFWRRERSR